MKRLFLLPLLVAAACSDQPTKQESLRIFAATNTVATTAQSNAVTVAKTGGASGDLDLNYQGTCSLGGSVSVVGSYSGDGNDEQAAFDLTTSFDGCKDIGGTLDGELRWTSKADANGFAASMTGTLDWANGNDSASCDFDLRLAVTESSITAGGSLCGYAAGELGITFGP